ncbi:hypothetical protein BSKO_09125 [Bryopsis sp. KO-2023]|nr:hypothetical protein BSKO_09125 [Bryopsis sp. KO-2023]
MLRYANRLETFIFQHMFFFPSAPARGLASSLQGEWGYRQMNQFQEIVGGFGLNSKECDRIASTLVAKDFRAMFKRLELNLKYAKDNGLDKQHTKSLLIKNINFFTGRPNVFEERWKGLAYEFDLTKKEMSDLLVEFPVVMEVSYTAKIKPMMDLFQEWGIPFSGFRQVFLKFPRVLKLSVDGQIIPLYWLFMEAGFRPEDFGSMVVREPLLLSLAPMVIRTRLQEIGRIGLARDEVASVLVENPLMIKYSMVKRMSWFESLLGVTDGRSVMRALLLKDPAIFMGSLTLMSRKMDVLKTFGIYKPERRVLLGANPFILSETKQDLRKKLRLATAGLGKSPKEIVKCPDYLTSPLDEVTDRILFIRARDLDVGSIDLKCLTSQDDGEFAQGVGVGLEDYLTFRGSVREQLKVKMFKLLGLEPIDAG